MILVIITLVAERAQWRPNYGVFVAAIAATVTWHDVFAAITSAQAALAAVTMSPDTVAEWC